MVKKFATFVDLIIPILKMNAIKTVAKKKNGTLYIYIIYRFWGIALFHMMNINKTNY